MAVRRDGLHFQQVGSEVAGNGVVEKRHAVLRARVADGVRVGRRVVRIKAAPLHRGGAVRRRDHEANRVVGGKRAVGVQGQERGELRAPAGRHREHARNLMQHDDARRRSGGSAARLRLVGVDVGAGDAAAQAGGEEERGQAGAHGGLSDRGRRGGERNSYFTARRKSLVQALPFGVMTAMVNRSGPT